MRYPKIVIKLKLFILIFGCLNAQNLTIINLSTIDFPKIKASLYAFDSEGRLIKDLKKEDFSVLEEGLSREVTLLSCPDFEQPEALSCVLVIDNSSSMRGYRLQLAKSAAKAWVNALPLGKSEVAITNFNDNSNILTDFTTDRNKLLSVINSIYYKGNTNYNAALLDPPAGAVNIAKNGKYKRVIVFLTDGQPNFFPEQEQIIQEAIDNDIVIYCVTLYMPAPSCIKQFSERTGGEWFENVTKIEEAEEIYRKILLKVMLDKPCELEWLSDAGCNITIREPIISDTTHKISSQKKYIIPTTNRSFLKIIPGSIRFPLFEPGKNYDTTIKVFAVNSDYGNIETDLKNPAFELSKTKFSLNTGDSIEIKVTFHCRDTLFKYSKIKFTSSACSSELYVSGGDFTSFGNQNTLKVTHPNGKEVFLVGLDTMITWEGVTPDDTVQIDYSYDNGINWTNITKKGIGLKHFWDTIPNTPSNKCIMRVKKISGNSYYSIVGYGFVKAMEYSPDGSILALASSTGHIMLLNPETGEVFKSFIAHDTKTTVTASGVNSMNFNFDGSKIVSSGYDGKIKVWDLDLGKSILEINAGYNVESVCFNPEGTMIVSGGSGKLIHLWSVETGDSIQSFIAHPTGTTVVRFSPDGSIFASAGNDAKIMVWNIDNPSQNFTLTGHSAKINCLDFSRDSSKLVSGSNDRSTRLWDLKTKKQIKPMSATGFVYSTKFSPDGKKIFSNSSDRIVYVYDGETGNNITNKSLDNYYTLAVSPDGNALACAEQNNITIKSTTNLTDSLTFSKGHRGSISFMEMSNDNKTIGTVGADTTIKIWDVETQTIKRTIPTSRIVLSFGMDASANYVAALLRINANQSVVNIWEVSTGEIIQSLPDSPAVWNKIAINPDGNIVACGFRTGGRVDLINIKTGLIQRTLTDDAKLDPILSIAFSSDGQRIICSSNNKIFMWDVFGGKFIGYIQAQTTYSLFSPTLETFSTIGSNLELWDSFTGRIINQIPNKDNISTITYSPDGVWLASGAKGTTTGKISNIKLWEGKTGYLIESLQNYLYNTNCSKFFSDGTKVAFGTDDGSIMIWHLNSLTKLTDNSDTLWSIVQPNPKSKDVNMGDVIVGSSKDSLVTTFITNDGNYPISVESITFSGIDSTNFELVSGFPPFIIQPNDSAAVEFRFKPETIGNKWSWIRINTKSKSLSQRILGRGVDMKIELLNNNIDFGKVKLGEYKDTIVTAVIKNVGVVSVNFLNSYHYKPNDKDFSTISGSAPFVLAGGEQVDLKLRFTPSFRGKTSGNLVYEFEAPNSPMFIQLFGEGYELIPEITTTGKRRINLICENEFIDSVIIMNTGDTILSISSMNFSNSKFQFLSSSTNLVIPPNETLVKIFKYTTNTIGKDTCDLIILSNAEPDSILTIQYIAIKDSAHLTSEVNEIDFGNLCPNQVKDTIITIRNTGTLKNNASLTLPSDYSITKNNFDIEANNSELITLSFLGRSLENSFSESLIITDSICGRVSKLLLKGRIRKPVLEVKDIVLGSTVGSSTESQLELKNVSEYDLTIIQEPYISDSQFSFINPQFPLFIPAKQNKFLTIKYEPKDSLEKSIPLIFDYIPCNESNTITVSGSPVAASVDIIIDTIKAQTGEIIEVPVYLKNPKNVELTSTTGYNLDLKFNYSILDPLDYPLAPISEGKRIISLDLPKIPSENNIIAKIRCRVCLGNSDETDLEIVNYKSIGGVVAIRKKDGKLIVTDICREGGKRLINPEGKTQINLIAPNPATGYIEVNFSSFEAGYCELNLISNIGKELLQLYKNDDTPIGDKSLLIDVSDLSSGMYYLILKTSTIVKSNVLMIIK